MNLPRQKLLSSFIVLVYRLKVSKFVQQSRQARAGGYAAWGDPIGQHSHDIFALTRFLGRVRFPRSYFTLILVAPNDTDPIAVVLTTVAVSVSIWGTSEGKNIIVSAGFKGPVSGNPATWVEP